MLSPPDKSRGIKQAFGSSIFSNFNRVALFEVCQAFPDCSAIFPLNTKVPTFGCFPHFIVSAMLDVHISRLNGMDISFVVNNAFHKILLSAFNIKLGIHIFCNHIGSIFISIGPPLTVPSSSRLRQTTFPDRISSPMGTLT
jgi:hypothetical protein